MDCSGPGIARRGRRRGFEYVDEDGERIDELEVLERIRELVIPPAWEDVWICPYAFGHIQAAGTDAAGRRQYIYHQRWRERRDQEKFDEMTRFARALFLMSGKRRHVILGRRECRASVCWPAPFGCSTAVSSASEQEATPSRTRPMAWLAGRVRLRWMAAVHPARHLLRAKDLVDARYREPLDVATLARAARLSTAHFSREFRRAFGETPHQYLLTRRMERAAALLRTTDRSVADICFTVGLRSVGSFTTTFGRIFGMSPTAYRASYPPAVTRARIPTCVLLTYSRPQSSSFREDSHKSRG